jgi:hypothetical protein
MAGRSWELQKLLHGVDTAGTGKFPILEVSRLLVLAGLSPNNRTEQRNLERLFLEVDHRGTGTIDVRGFELLFVRFEEFRARTFWEQLQDEAAGLGFSEEETAQIFISFGDADINDEGNLSIRQLEEVLTKLKRSPASFEDMMSAVFAGNPDLKRSEDDASLSNNANPGPLRPRGMSSMGASSSVAPSSYKEDESIMLSLSAVLKVVHQIPPYYEFPLSAQGQNNAQSTIKSKMGTDWVKPGIVRRALRLLGLPRGYIHVLPDCYLVKIWALYMGEKWDGGGGGLLVSKIGVRTRSDMMTRSQKQASKIQPEVDVFEGIIWLEA